MRALAIYQMKLTGICSAMHLLVDGTCVCCLYLMASSFPATQIIGLFITYNVLAFMTQPFTGMWADRLERKHWMLLASIMLLTMAVLATSVFMAIKCHTVGMPVVAVLLGAGNSLFHVWGGKQVAIGTDNDIRSLGMFVSTGAFGLALGMVFFSWALLYLFLLALCLLSVACLHYDKPTTSASTIVGKFSTSFVLLSVTGLMAAVLMRSYIGETFSTGLPKSNTMVLLIGTVSMLGKMVGGWMARWMGIVRALVAVLLALAVCFFFKNHGTLVLLAALFAVNCTMPFTLYLANVVLPGKEGLAFGLLAAALIPGYLIAFCL